MRIVWVMAVRTGTAHGLIGGLGTPVHGPVGWVSSTGSALSSALGPTARGARTSWKETWSIASVTSGPAEVDQCKSFWITDLHILHWFVVVYACLFLFVDPAVDGGWSRWSPWSRCDKRCGGGRSIRTRSCSSPPPKNGGKKCEGEKNQVKPCNTKPCGALDTQARCGSVSLNRSHAGMTAHKFNA